MPELVPHTAADGTLSKSAQTYRRQRPADGHVEDDGPHPYPATVGRALGQ